MTSAAERPRITVDDYLAGEVSSAVKHEYVAGEVFAMAGAGKAHATVAGNLFSLRRNADGNWVLHPFIDSDELELASIDFRCPMDAVYEDVELLRLG